MRTECGNPILPINGPPFMSTRRICAISGAVNKPPYTASYLSLNTSCGGALPVDDRADKLR